MSNYCWQLCLLARVLETFSLIHLPLFLVDKHTDKQTDRHAYSGISSPKHHPMCAAWVIYLWVFTQQCPRKPREFPKFLPGLVSNLDPSISKSCTAGITGVNHHAWPPLLPLYRVLTLHIPAWSYYTCTERAERWPHRCDTRCRNRLYLDHTQGYLITILVQPGADPTAGVQSTWHTWKLQMGPACCATVEGWIPGAQSQCLWIHTVKFTHFRSILLCILKTILLSYNWLRALSTHFKCVLWKVLMYVKPSPQWMFPPAPTQLHLSLPVA
jgi:hypothetical protein